MKKRKINIKSLKVNSFVTSIEQKGNFNTIKGGQFFDDDPDIVLPDESEMGMCRSDMGMCPSKDICPSEGVCTRYPCTAP